MFLCFNLKKFFLIINYESYNIILNNTVVISSSIFIANPNILSKKPLTAYKYEENLNLMHLNILKFLDHQRNSSMAADCRQNGKI